MPTPEPGLHQGVSDEEYFSWEALNNSTIKRVVEKSVLHAHYELSHPSTPTDPQMEGRAFHAMLLQPEIFKTEFAEMPVTEKGIKHRRDTKKGAEAWDKYEEEHPNAWPLKKVMVLKHEAMRESIMRNPTARTLIENASMMEACSVWEHPEYGFPCKAKFDIYGTFEGYGTITDVKTTVDASDAAWTRAVDNFGYVTQAPWYLDGLNELSEAERRFLFIAVEKTPPYAVQVHELNSLAMFEGRYRIRKVCAKWDKALRTKSFPSYQGGVNLHGLAAWALTHEREEEVDIS